MLKNAEEAFSDVLQAHLHLHKHRGRHGPTVSRLWWRQSQKGQHLVVLHPGTVKVRAEHPKIQSAPVFPHEIT